MTLPTGWHHSTLGENARFLSGNTPSKENSAYWSGDFPWITARDMKTLWLKDATLGLTEAGRTAAAIAPPQSVLLLTRGMTLLKNLPVCLIDREMAFNQDIKALVPSATVDSTFLAYQLLANKHEILNLVDMAGHGTGRLDTDLLKFSEFVVPPLPEQRRIARVLSTWDQAIATTERLLANSRKQKQVLTHQVLTGKRRLMRFGSSNAKRPTPYGALPADWEYRPIADFAHEVSEKLGDEQPHPVLSCTKHGGLVDSLSYFNKQVFSADTSTYRVAPRNSFVYATNHIDEGSIGYQDLHDYGLVSPMYTVFKTDATMSDGYLYRLLKTEHYRQIFASATNASVDRRGSLRWKEFKKLHVPVPPLPEQEAIGALIDITDREIKLVSVQLASLRSERTALMAQLLTGKRRVRLSDPDEEVRT